MSSNEQELQRYQDRLVALKEEERRVKDKIAALDRHQPTQPAGLESLPLFSPPPQPRHRVTNNSHNDDKIDLFYDLFCGRTDVFAVRWQSADGDKKGFSPECAIRFQPGCALIKGGKCKGCKIRQNREFDRAVIAMHLRGRRKKDDSKEFAVGAYPLLLDETCNFIVADFDKADFQSDVQAFKRECLEANIPVYLERSRSGKGCHAWVFFTFPVSARSARRMMLTMITKAMEGRPDLGFDSYDRLLPNQEKMPKGGFGNLVGLPLQGRPRLEGNSVFVDDNWQPFEDQWAYLSDIRKMDPEDVERISSVGTGSGTILGIQMPPFEEHADEPWKMRPSRPITAPSTLGLTGKTIKMVLGDQLYVDRESLPTAAVMQFARIGAFQNPAFYQTQNLGLWTGDTPRVISASEIFPEHIALPRGCTEDALDLSRQYGAVVDFQDVRQEGKQLPDNITFKGELRPRQVLALESLLAHDIGIIKAPPAFGKTVVTIAAIAKRRRNTLIIVFTKIVFDQWKQRLKTFLNVEPGQIGWIGGGKDSRTGIIDVALIQTLSRNKGTRDDILAYVSDIVGDYGHVAIDEVHHLAADTYEPVSRRAKAKYFLGASATPKRKDGRHPLIFMQMGAIRYQVEAKQLIAESGMAHIYRQRKTAFKFSPELREMIDAKDYNSQDIIRALAEDEDRNYMIFDDVLRAMDRGRCPIVLTSRKDHLDNLYERFKPHAKNVIVLKGAMKASERRLAEELMAKPADEERLILATGQFLGEGFDDNRLDALFMTMPTVWEGTLEQYSGRLQRQYVGKASVEIIDYVDREEGLMRKADDRTKVFKRIGFTIADAETSKPYAEA
jgi:superfamily II DNA or RNA helicase